MHSATWRFRACVAACLLWAGIACGQPAGSQPQPTFIRQGQQLIRQGKLERALTVYERELEMSPDSLAANNAAGVVLDLLGRTVEARKYFNRAIRAAPDDRAKASARRNMGISYAFDGNCKGAGNFHKQVFDYYAGAGNFFQQGEVSNELARICLEAGDLDTAQKWYRTGYEAGLREPDLKPDRKDLWEFRWAHAQGRIAARRGSHAEARKHVAAARAILDRGTNPEQEQFFPYLAGYVALYGGDAKTAIAELMKANQNDPFIQCLIGQAYEKAGDREKALEFDRKAAGATGHNPAVAHARPFASKRLAKLDN
jgi:tetratricopeptide (TPR) repeat protein